MKPHYSTSIFLIVILLSLSGCARKDKKKEAGTKGKALSVQVMVAKPGPLTNILTVTGTLLSNETVELHPEISGKLVSISFEEGSTVKKEQVLARLRDSDLHAQMEKLRSQENIALTDEQRKKKLLSLNGISQEEYDLALNQLSAVRADIGVLNAQLEKTVISAPFDGVMGLRQVSEGSIVSPSTVIARIEEHNPLKLEFAVPEKYIAQIRPGTDVSFRTENTTGYLEAKVYATETSIDVSTRSLMVRARCPNPGMKLRPGAFARVEVSLEKTDSAIVLPASALIAQIKGYRIYTSVGGKAKAVDVITGLRTDTTVQIISGLRPGDSVIISGLMTIKEGMPLIVGGAHRKKTENR